MKLHAVDLLAIGLIAWTVAADPADPGVYIAVVGTVLFFWAVTRNLMRKAAHLEIAERAEHEHNLWMSGDANGFYGQYPPADQ